jgi:tetratricopeptide (TPR) repeat protein
MKLFKYIFYGSFALLTSCNKFLDVEPRESVSDEQTIFDKTSAEEAVNGIYNALANGDYYGTGFQSIGYLSGDNVQWTGSQSQIQEFINHNVRADNSTIAGAWSAIYRTINRANQVLSKVPGVNDPQLTAALKNQLLGEAYFIRGLAFFDLARTWGGAPVITQPTNSVTDNIGIPRSTQAETYQQALSDLEAAEPLLPVTLNRYRATQKTVWALKARYYLYQRNWSKAEEYATKIIDENASFKLVAPYSAFFANNARGTTESIFEIFYNGTTEVNAHRNQWQPQTNGGTRQWAPNGTLVALLNDPLAGGNRSALVAKDNQDRWYGNLYYRSPASDPSFIIRIAELYLIRAEARAHLDNLPGAVSDLDAVRVRAGLAASTASGSEEILLAIENERRIEFALEPHRWFDLVRTGRATTVLNFTDEKKYLMPLPTQQLLLDGALEQNEGY